MHVCMWGPTCWCVASYAIAGASTQPYQSVLVSPRISDRRDRSLSTAGEAKADWLSRICVCTPYSCLQARALNGLDPEETMAVVISKTFTTAETMLNARTVRSWLTSQLGE